MNILDLEFEPMDVNEVFGVTFDYNEWLEECLTNMKADIEHNYYDEPENLREDVIRYYNQVKDYIEGFLTLPVGLYKGQTLTAKYLKYNSFDDLVENLETQKKEGNKLFLLSLGKNFQREKEITIEGNSGNVNYPRSVSTHYFVRYAVLNDE